MTTTASEKNQKEKSGYLWHVPILEFDNALDGLKNVIKGIESDPFPYIKKIIFPIITSEKKYLLEKLCSEEKSLNLDYFYLLEIFESAMLDDFKNKYINCDVLEKYIEQNSFIEITQIKLFEFSATSPRARSFLKTFVEKKHICEKTQNTLIKLSADNNEMQKILLLYINKKSFDGFAKDNLLEFVKLSYGNRRMTAILDIYKSRNEFSLKCVEEMQKNLKKYKYLEIMKRRKKTEQSYKDPYIISKIREAGIENWLGNNLQK